MKRNFYLAKALCGCAGLLFAVALSAAPAPWYLWRSKLDGGLTCQQFSPGPGWVRHDGPFGDVLCEKRLPARK